MDLAIETAADEVFTVVSKLHVTNCFCMTDISMSLCFVFHNIKKMHFSLRGTKQKEMTCFGEKSDNLKTLFITSDPTTDFFLREKAVITSSFVVDRWFDIA